MLNPECIPDVAPDEMTCRFIVAKNHVNRQSGMVKANAFLPETYTESSVTRTELSVTRLTQATDDEIWDVGHRVAARRNPPRTFRGRADVLVQTFLGQGLQVVADPTDDNPNHANVRGWPENNKDGQLMKAKEIAAVATFVRPPV